MTEINRSTLFNAYMNQRVRGLKPVAALNNARNENPGVPYRSKKPEPAVYWLTDDRGRRDGRAIIGRPERAGLRTIGYVDADFHNGRWEAEAGKSGWYADMFHDRLYQGVIFYLPGCNGATRVVPGYYDGDAGTYIVHFADMYTDDAESRRASCDVLLGAASCADDIARNAAEEAQEYDRAWQAGAQWMQLAEETAETWQRVKELQTERHVLRARTEAGSFPSTCDALRDAVRSFLNVIRSNREGQARLRNGEDPDFYFYTGSSTLCRAFNDGACETVL